MAAATTTTARKSSATDARQARKILEIVNKMSPESLAATFEEFQQQFTATATGLHASCGALLQQFTTLQQGVAATEDRLAELHDVQKTALAIDNMQQMHDERKARLDGELRQRQEAVATAIATAEADMKRKHEEAEYYHKTQVERFKTEFEAQVKEAQRNEEHRRQDLESEWASREEVLATKEARLEEMQAKIDSIPDMLAEVESATLAKAITDNDVKTSAETGRLRATIAANEQLAKQREESLKSQITMLQEQIASLQEQLNKANAAVSDVTRSALESASGRQALHELQQQTANSASGSRRS